TNFFDLGGHSLKATRVVSQVYKQLGLQVSLREIFLHPTVGELSKVLEDKEQEGYQSISPVADQSYYEISHAQRRLWVLDQFEAEKAYNIPSGYVLDGELDVCALEQALTSVIARHESLRTRFISVEGEPKQEVVPVEDFGFSLEQVDLRKYEDRNERAHIAVTAASGCSFDLSKGALVRAHLYRLEEDRHLFLVVLHHIISDG
ncbi:condensation domain-containing protein, partial [Fulvivirga kasyanovii]|uniref:condensation domain-containing protein n=1 Tax=Fulvivirga kasyanovii TaxID=396812 RepID=UPI0031E01E1A